jgi:hypothetical protein
MDGSTQDDAFGRAAAPAYNAGVDAVAQPLTGQWMLKCFGGGKVVPIEEEQVQALHSEDNVCGKRRTWGCRVKKSLKNIIALNI